MEELKSEHLVYLSDEIYTPISYKGMIVEQPFFRGFWQCGRKTLDLNIILMRATNPRKAMKGGIYHTRVLVAVYSFLL